MRVFEKSCGVEPGKQFANWLVIGKPFSIGDRMKGVVVQCRCGRTAVVHCNNLSTGRSKGCISCHVANINHRHGDKLRSIETPRLYTTWRNMKARCNNPNSTAYADYGGRGIAICEEWNSDYRPFKEWALANGYCDDKEIDRRDNNLGYSPSNCRFVTTSRNVRNRRVTRMLTAFGETKPMADWAEDARAAVPYKVISQRVSRGWPHQVAIASKIGERHKELCHA